MSGNSLRGVLCACLLAAPLAAQLTTRSADQFPGAEAVAAILDVGDFTVQPLVIETTGTTVTTPVVIDGQALTLALYPVSLRAPDYKLLVDANGVLSEVEPDAPTTYKGEILEVPGSSVAASFKDGMLDVVMRLGDGLPLWAVEPLRKIDGSASGDDYIVYSADQLIDRGWTCGADTLPRPDTEPSSPGSFEGAANVLVCEIACDADVEFYNSNGGSVANTEADIENIINRCELIYEPQTGIQYEITTIIVRTSEPDPYTSTSPNTLLNQFDNEWSNNQQGVQRDIAHLFTGKNLNGSVIGIASLGVICSQFSGYGLSQSKFSGSIISRTALTAHELGHNWSAQHCNGQSDCGIMCSGIGGCSGNLQAFGQIPINQILNEKNSSNCLDDAVPPPPPTVASISPSAINPLGGELLTITGTGLLKAVEVQIGSTTFDENPFDGFTIFSDEMITVRSPVPSALGDVDVFVTNTGGSSNTVPLTYIEQVPPLYTATTIVIPFVEPFAEVTYATEVGHLCFWVFSFSGTTGTFQGFDLLASPLFILSLPLTPVGTGFFELPLGVELAGMGIAFWTQMAFVENGTIIDISNTVKTTVF